MDLEKAKQDEKYFRGLGYKHAARVIQELIEEVELLSAARAGQGGAAGWQSLKDAVAELRATIAARKVPAQSPEDVRQWTSRDAKARLEVILAAVKLSDDAPSAPGADQP